MARKPPEEPVEQGDESPENPPFGVDNHGRAQSDAGQEGAQAVHEYVNHQRGRIEDAEKGPDYSHCYQIRRPRVDET